MKKYWWLIVLAVVPLALAQERERPGGGSPERGRGRGPLWVKYDAETKTLKLSSGVVVTQQVTAGAFVGYDRQGQLRERRTWRPPQDIEIKYAPTNASRVVFSHERHFGALGAKDCKSCHAEEKGLGKDKPWKSFAADSATEPHGEKSKGRFCAECHRDTLKAEQIPGAHPPVNVVLFAALGKTGDATCAHCHAPADHGTDATGSHGHRAERGAAQCVTCHRGATTITSPELQQANQYRAAQLALVKNPDDAPAFRHTLPNNFCAYCHLTDRRPWRGGED